MAKGSIRVTGDPNVKVGEYVVCDDGEHLVDGFTFILPKDKTEPMFVEQNGKLIVRLKLSKVDGTEGPAYSATPAQLFALVSAFGAKLPAISAENRTTTRSLLALKTALEATSPRKVLTVTSKDGWVNKIPDAMPPKGVYTVQFVGAHRTDYEEGNLDWSSVATKKGGTMTVLIAEFEIIGDMYGKASVWNGYQFGIFMNKSFVTEKMTIGGEELEPVDTPVYIKTETGGIPLDVRRWQGFIEHFAPEVEDHDWQSDVLNSSYGVNEVTSPQYIIFGTAFKNRKQHSALALLDVNKSGNLSMDLKDLLGSGQATQQEEEPQPDELFALITFIEKLAGKDAFVQSIDNKVVFSDTGRQWARETFGAKNGPWERAGLSIADHRPLHELKQDECKALLKELVGQFETSATVANTTEEPW